MCPKARPWIRCRKRRYTTSWKGSIIGRERAWHFKHHTKSYPRKQHFNLNTAKLHLRVESAKENPSIYAKIHHTSLKPCQVNPEPSFSAGIFFNMGVLDSRLVQPRRQRGRLYRCTGELLLQEQGPSQRRRVPIGPDRTARQLGRRHSAEFALHKAQRGLVAIELPFQLGILDRGENFPKQGSRSKTHGDEVTSRQQSRWAQMLLF